MEVLRIIEETLNLTKQSCKNITTSKSYLKGKKGKTLNVILKDTIINMVFSKKPTLSAILIFSLAKFMEDSRFPYEHK